MSDAQVTVLTVGLCFVAGLVFGYCSPPQHPSVITKCVAGTPVFIPTDRINTQTSKGRWM